MDKNINLGKILELHKMWLNGEEGGICANLSKVDFSGANLRGVDLRGSDMRWANLSKVDFSRANLSNVDFSGANLRGANLSGANLRGANLDFSCLPLWCGSLSMKVDKRLSAQIAYHFCSLKCDDEEVKALQESLYDFANTFHRIEEVKRLEKEQTDNV